MVLAIKVISRSDFDLPRFSMFQDSSFTWEKVVVVRRRKRRIWRIDIFFQK
jgi:hypothetical protein